MIINETMTVRDQRISKAILAIAGIIIFMATFAGKMPGGMIGALGIMVVVGAILNFIGDRTPIINQFFGGGAIVVIFGSAYLFHSGFFPTKADENVTTFMKIFHSGFFPTKADENVTTFMKSGGFLAFYVASLVTGSILGMDTQTLKKAALKYIPVILGSAFVACVLTGVVGMLLSKDFYDSVMLIALPIMGGGMGAGAVPLVEIMSGKTGMNAETLMSQMVPALAIGNAIAIVMAGLLNKLGQMAPSLTGNGQLIRGQKAMVDDSEESSSLNVTILGVGALLAMSMYFVGTVLSSFISMHTYALMILSIALIKVSGIMPKALENAAHSWYKFVVSNLTPALLVGIGVAYTNLNQIMDALSPLYFFLVFTTVMGAILGAGLVGWLMGFYPIEAAITGGLCMANMGGTGDVAVLAASKRMELMPFAQISSRIGGAFMLILATIVVQSIA